jgi:hypothetical protein
MASLAPYSITLGGFDYPIKYSGLLAYIEPYLTNLETFSFSGGNVGLGVTPSAWQASWKVAQFSRDAAFGGVDGGAVYGFMSVNAYATGTGSPASATWRYGLTGSLASLYEQTSGQHIWKYAASGTAGNPITFTTGMTLDASGALILSGSTAQKATGTTWSNPSDQRLKKNIRDYTKGTAELMQVRVRQWDYNGLGGTSDGTQGLGVVADEVMQVLPDTVSTYRAKLHAEDEADTEIKKFDATEITWLLVKTVQEQQALVTSLRNRVAALEAA